MRENMKPLNEKDVPQTQINFFQKMAASSEYILKNHEVPEQFQGIYIHYKELGKK